jgi:hypothetical protein
LRHIHPKQKYDLTPEEFSTYKELEDVYNTGKPRGYYGFKEMLASRLINLIEKVHPEFKKWVTDDYNERPVN